MHTTPRFVVAALGAVLLASPLVAQDKAVAIRGAQVFTGKGAFQKNVTIVMSGGKIQAIGQGIAIPEGAETIDASGRWITPGLVDANTSLGLPSPHENEQSSEVTPHIPVRHAINPDAPDMKRALRAGVTTAYIAPGGLNVFGGIGCVYKTAGKSRMLKDESGTRMTLGNMPGQGNMPFRTFGTPASMYFRRPNNRMGVIWEVRRAFYDAMNAKETNIGPVQQPTAATKILIDALDGKRIVRTTAFRDQDIRTALRLADEFGIKIVVDGAVEAYAALDYLVAAGVPVVASPPSLSQGGEGATPHLDTLKLLSEAGVKVAIQTGNGQGALDLVREAAWAVRGGMKRIAALEAVTSTPAEILGVGDRVGTLAKGRDADLVVWSRHPLSLASRAERVFVDGLAR